MLKKFPIKIFFLLFGIFITTNVLAQQENFPFVGQVNRPDVNVRAGQNTNFEKLFQLKKDDNVVVVGKSFNWYKIQLPTGAKGYVSREYVRTINRWNGEITANRLNMRARPELNSSVIGQIEKGQLVLIEDIYDEWVKIQVPQGHLGWVSADLVDFKSHNMDKYFPPSSVEHAEPSTESEGRENSLSEIIAEALSEETPRESGADSTLKSAAVGVVEPVVPKIELPVEDVSVKGKLEKMSKASEGVEYKLTVDGVVTHYIKGFDYILDDFVGYTVSIKGKTNPKLKEHFSNPVLTVLTVQLVL